MQETFEIAVSNLTSVSVLVFVLGVVAALIKTDIKIPEPVYQTISIYLLFGIGLKGGVSLSQSEISDVSRALLVTLVLAVIVPIAAFTLLKFVPNLGVVDRGSLAAHYGSTSLVTFSAALVFLESSNLSYPGYATTLLTVMEIPGIAIGIFLASRGLGSHVSWKESLHEVLLGKTVLLLIGGLVIGYYSGPAGYSKVTPFFVDLLPGILALFLLNLGAIAGSRLGEIRTLGVRMLGFGILFPVLAGSTAIGVSFLAGLPMGTAFILGILSASASYIAAPAAVGLSLPTANQSLAITSSLAVTFPFNLIVGIPLLNVIASSIYG